MLKLFLLTQDERTGYDTYDSIIVCAKDEESAKQIHPYGLEIIEEWERSYKVSNWSMNCWCSCPEEVKVELIGFAYRQKEGVILSSYFSG